MGIGGSKKNKDEIKREDHIIGHAKSISKFAMSKINEQMDNSVCKIINQKSKGTGFICSIPFPNKLISLPVLITCYHVLGSEELKPGKEIKLIFNGNEKTLQLNESRKIYTSNEKEYDISIIELKSEDKFDLNNLLEIEYDIFKDEILDTKYKNKSIYILHYPNGNEIEYSVDTIKNIDAKNIKVSHCCTTEEGSSGGPILNLQTFQILGVHNGKHSIYNWNIGTILKFPINEFNKKYKNDFNIKFDSFIDSNNEEKLNKKKKFNGMNSIDIEIIDSFICIIKYNLPKINLKELGFFVRIPPSNSKTSIKGFLTKYHVEEYILKDIETINIFQNNNILVKLDSKDRFYFSDQFLDTTFIEIKNSNFKYIKIKDKNYDSENLSLINYSQENNSFKFTDGEILENWGINIFYKEHINYFDSDYEESSYINFGLFVNNNLVGIHKKNNYKDKIATNIKIINQAIKLNYFSKIKNNSKLLEKEKKEEEFLSENQIMDLKKIGLELSTIPNILISPPSLGVSPIWFYRTKHAWYWTPTKPDKDDLYKANWMIICPGNSLEVIGGFWNGIEPVQKNIDIIHWLETTELKYLI